MAACSGSARKSFHPYLVSSGAGWRRMSGFSQQRDPVCGEASASLDRKVLEQYSSETEHCSHVANGWGL